MQTRPNSENKKNARDDKEAVANFDAVRIDHYLWTTIDFMQNTKVSRDGGAEDILNQKNYIADFGPL